MFSLLYAPLTSSWTFSCSSSAECPPSGGWLCWQLGRPASPQQLQLSRRGAHCCLTRSASLVDRLLVCFHTPRNLSTLVPSRLQIDFEFSVGDYMLICLLPGLLLGQLSLWENCRATAAAQSRFVAATVRMRTCPIQPTPPAKWGVVVGVQVVCGGGGANN